jgi:drug/metabolite transporter (DMT)-like permease
MSGTGAPLPNVALRSKQSATLLGFGAILLWSSLALLTALSGTMPPFQLAAVTFLIGGLAGALTWLVRPSAARALRQPWPVWLLGVGGLFGYHALYFAALRLAPPAEAGLINYLWPLLIVLFATLLAGERLRANVVLGAVLGLCGVVVLFFGRGGGLVIEPRYLAGYACAFAAAFVWAIYSVLSRKVASVPTDAVAGFCLATAALSALCHLTFEITIWPADILQWSAVIGLGLGPVGAAFYLWDHGVKRGDLPLLGVLSYAAPVLSTLLLVIGGVAAASWTLALSCLFIVVGALIASFGRRAPVSA